MIFMCGFLQHAISLLVLKEKWISSKIRGPGSAEHEC